MFRSLVARVRDQNAQELPLPPAPRPKPAPRRPQAPVAPGVPRFLARKELIVLGRAQQLRADREVANANLHSALAPGPAAAASKVLSGGRITTNDGTTRTALL